MQGVLKNTYELLPLNKAFNLFIKSAGKAKNYEDQDIFT